VLLPEIDGSEQGLCSTGHTLQFM